MEGEAYATSEDLGASSTSCRQVELSRLPTAGDGPVGKWGLRVAVGAGPFLHTHPLQHLLLPT